MSIGWYEGDIAGRNDLVNNHPQVPTCYMTVPAAVQKTTTTDIIEFSGVSPTQQGLPITEVHRLFKYPVRIKTFERALYGDAARHHAEQFVRQHVDPGYVVGCAWLRRAEAGLHHMNVVGVGGLIKHDPWGDGKKIETKTLHHLEYSELNALDGCEGRWRRDGFPVDPNATGDWALIYPEQYMPPNPSPTRVAVHSQGVSMTPPGPSLPPASSVQNPGTPTNPATLPFPSTPTPPASPRPVADRPHVASPPHRPPRGVAPKDRQQAPSGISRRAEQLKALNRLQKERTRLLAHRRAVSMHAHKDPLTSLDSLEEVLSNNKFLDRAVQQKAELAQLLMNIRAGLSGA